MYEDVSKEAERKASELAKKMLEEETQKAELEEFPKWKSTVSEEVKEPPKKKNRTQENRSKENSCQTTGCKKVHKEES